MTSDLQGRQEGRIPPEVCHAGGAPRRTVLDTSVMARRGRRSSRVPAADAFFLDVESETAPQHVGGVVLLDHAERAGGPPTRAEVESRVRLRLGELPRFRQRLAPCGGRPAWQDVGELDWEWHVPLVDLTCADGTPGGTDAFHALVAGIAGTRLPRDRPLWRLVVVHGIEPGVSGVVLVVHHVVADGIGTVAQALRLLEPDVVDRGADGRAPGPVRRSLAIALGLAQLATDGRPRSTLPSGGTAERRFGTMRVPLADLRTTAREHDARVTDVLLCAAASAVRQALLDKGVPPPEHMRVSVPLLAGDPRAGAEGNVTAAVLLDVPLGDMVEGRRLAAITARTSRLRTPSRALASRFVMNRLMTLLPSRFRSWFARTVYGHRFFSAIVSNMPGPDQQLALVGAPLLAAFPLLPLAPGAPLAVGSLGWNGTMCTSVAVDPALSDDANAIAAAMRAAVGRLRTEGRSTEDRRTEDPV